MRRLVPALQAVTLLALAAAATLLAWHPSVSAKAEPTILPRLTLEVPALDADGTALADSIVDANIFSLTREAPDERTFVAAPTDSPVEDVTSGEYAADAGAMDSAGVLTTTAEAVPALYGVVNGPHGRAALLRLDASVAGSRLFRAGEGTAGYTVRAIGADRVELTGPHGAVVLELVARGGTP